MAGIALLSQPLDLVVLGDADRSFLSRLSPMPARHIPLRADTSADRKLTASHLDRAVLDAGRPVLLVAQGAACLAAAWWTRLSPQSYVSRVTGALMLAPRRAGERDAMFASPASRLPFPSIVVGADDASQQWAVEWGSRLIDGPLPGVGPALSNRFQSILSHFTRAIVELDIRTAERLMAAIGDR